MARRQLKNGEKSLWRQLYLAPTICRWVSEDEDKQLRAALLSLSQEDFFRSPESRAHFPDQRLIIKHLTLEPGLSRY